MKFCLRWTNICKSLKSADETTIKYIEDRGLVDFLEKYKDKRINLLIDTLNFEEKEIYKLIAIRKTHPEYDFAVAMNNYSQSLMELFTKSDIPHYLYNQCYSWELLYKLVEQDMVSDINLSGPLAFELPKVKKYLDSLDRKVQVRITPNVCASEYETTPKLVQFFIRPDDLELYAPYIDVVEFEGIEHQDTFFKIYAQQKTFYGKLNQVIYNFPDSVDNKGLINLFGQRRISCGRECLKGGHCRRCYSLVSIANNISPMVTKQIQDNITKELEDKKKSNEN